MSNYTKVENLIEKKNSEYHEEGKYYNCMGWALDKEEWLRPVEYGDFWEREGYINELLWEYEDDEDRVREETLTSESAALVDNWGLRYATPAEVQDESVDLIAFREQIDICLEDDGRLTCYDTDFHFRKRIDGIWTEKCGSGNIRVCKNDTINSDCWCGIYDSDIVYFVKEG